MAGRRSRLAGLVASLLLILPAAAHAQPAGALEGGGPSPDLPTAAVRVERSLALALDPAGRIFDEIGILSRLSTAAPQDKARADGLIGQARDARAARRPSEARRTVAEAATLLLGQPWTADRAFAYSLAVEVTELVADPAQPLHYRLTQLYPAKAGGLTLRMVLSTLAPPQRGATPNRPEQAVRTFSVAPLGQLTPRTRTVALGRLADGDYALEARVYRGSRLVGISRAPVRVVTGLAATETSIRSRLAGLKGRDDTVAAITYPFDTAQAVNGWRRDIPENLDFAAAIQRSRLALAALEAGRDPLWRTTGDQYRAYRFDRAGETMPYRLYVPRSWTPGAKFPLVVDLHGGGGNEDSDFRPGRFGGLMQQLAEKHGFIIVAPLGFRPNGGYGVVYGKTLPTRDGVRPTAAAGETVSTLSEADTLAVIARVSAEYATDPARTYLVGNSMGGGGVWYLGAKYGAMFAAIAPCASSMPFDSYDFAKLQAMPVRIVVGSLDAELRRQLAASAFDTLTRRGAKVTLTVMPNETHTEAWLAALPDTFAFFAAQRRPE